MKLKSALLLATLGFGFAGSAFAGNPGQGNPGQGNPGQGNPGQGNPGQGNPGQGNPGQGNPGQGNPGQGNPGQGGQCGCEPPVMVCTIDFFDCDKHFEGSAPGRLIAQFRAVNDCVAGGYNRRTCRDAVVCELR